MEISSELFEAWQNSLEDFHKGVKKDLEEIRNYKEEVQQMKLEIYDRLHQGTYIQDDKRIVISAPEVIIGNVDADGILKSNFSRVILRGNHVGLEGVGHGAGGTGTIVSRAPFIQQIGVDPGPDGVENVVKTTSMITSQAHAISLRSNETDGLFTESGVGTGISLQSDTHISINATLANESRQENLDNLNKAYKDELKDHEKEADRLKKIVDKAMKELKDVVKRDEYTYDADLMDIRTSTAEISELQDEFNTIARNLYQYFNDYLYSISQLAETHRKIACVEEEKKVVSKYKSSYKDKSTGTGINIGAESISLKSTDGEGNSRTNPEAGIGIDSRNIQISSYGDKGELIEDSAISLSAENIRVSTANPKIKDGKGDFLATGIFSVSSQHIVMEGVDYSLNNDKVEEKALTKNGSFFLRFEDIKMDTTGTDGKADGHIGINSKQVEVKTMDVDKDSRKDKSLTAGSSLLLLSEKIFTGSKEKNTKSKLLQLASDEIAVIGEKAVELQQDKAIVQLSGGNTSLSGGKTQIYGTITMNGKTSFKADVDAGNIDVKNIKIQSSFKSPCTSEGMAVPGAPSTAKLNAKLKEEEFKSTDK